LNGKRLPERIVSLLPSATEILLEIGKPKPFYTLKAVSVLFLGWKE
jgi:ABC-type Fe3+-hydroxamate transport system substrate-binding protein